MIKLIRLLFQPELNRKDWNSKISTPDRLSKYFCGTIRIVIFICIISVSNSETLAAPTLPWGSALLIGSIGATTNTSWRGKRIDALLCFGTLFGVLWHYASNMQALGIISSYALKTAVGDTLAGKN